MIFRYSFIYFITLLLAFSSKGQINPNATRDVYNNKQIGWSMSIPDEWISLPDSIRESNLKDVERKTHLKSNQNSTIKLLSFRKSEDLKNPIFMSGIIKISYLAANGINSPQKYLEYSAKLIEKSNVTLDKSFGTKTIDGHIFNSYIFNRVGSPVMQKGLVAFYGNYLLYLTWVYQNKDDDILIEKAVETSKFKMIK